MAETLRARCLGLALTGLTLAAGTASAQTVVIGSARPSVTVDLGVLDTLGPAPTLPSMLRSRSSHRVALRPPAPGMRPAAPTRSAAQEPSRPAFGSPQPLASVPAPMASAAPPPPPPRVAAAPPPAAPPVAAPPPPRVAAAAPPVAVPPPAPAAAPPPPAPQTAARPPSASLPAAPVGAGPRLVFGAGSSELPAGADATLKDMAQRLNADEALRLQVVAYADGTPEQASQARRLSLSRALTVRSYLISQGVRSTRIDVRALGSRATDGPPDRVDLLIGDR